MSIVEPDAHEERPTRLWRGRLLLFVALTLIPGAVSFAVSRAAEQETLQLRELRVAAQRLERQDALLSAPAVDDVLLALGEDGDALRVRLLETVSDIAAWPSADQLDFTIDAQRRADDAALVLRLLVEVELTNGATLIELLARLTLAATPWPAALRGCEVQRLPTGMLDVQCALDVLHWSDLQVPEQAHAD